MLNEKTWKLTIPIPNSISSALRWLVLGAAVPGTWQCSNPIPTVPQFSLTIVAICSTSSKEAPSTAKAPAILYTSAVPAKPLLPVNLTWDLGTATSSPTKRNDSEKKMEFGKEKKKV